jgi:hypothetical protein
MPDYNFGAPYYDARERRSVAGVRTIGSEHLILALLIASASPAVAPASPAAEALGCDLGAACRALDELDNQSLAAIGVEPGITATPVAVRASARFLREILAEGEITPEEPDGEMASR